MCVVAALTAASAYAQASNQNRLSGQPTISQPQAAKHVAPASAAPSEFAADEGPPRPTEEMAQDGDALAPVVMAPTRRSFLAHWEAVDGATGYHIDVSTSRSWKSYVNGYHDFAVGNVTNRIVSGLEPGTTYYYRVRPYNSFGAGNNSEMMTAATANSSGLVIDPTFDRSILNSTRSALLQSTITKAIAVFQSLLTDPITVSILFRYSSTEPDGTPIPSGFVSRSDYVVYSIPWSSYLASLRADAKSNSDTTANSSLPATTLSAGVVPSSASGRAIGLATPRAMFADGHVAVGGPYDGIVTLSSNQPLQFSRPPSSSSYDGRTATEHEIDEVLGLGSHLTSTVSGNLRPQDLFSWAAPQSRNTTAIGARYFSINRGSTKIVSFNQDSPGDFGDWLSGGSCPHPNPKVQDAFGCKGDSEDVTATSPEGVNLDVIGYDLVPPGPTPTPGPTTFGNISTRVLAKTDDQVPIGGFIITGSQPKKVIVRAIGPSLPLAGALANPSLELHSSDGLIASNDNWRSDQEVAIIATGVPPSDDLESAIVMTLDPGAYTAVVQGANGGTGVGLVEVYDLDGSVDSILANISTRGVVQTGDDVLIGGFIVVGSDPLKTLVRAIGPSLPLTGRLANPTLELHNSDGDIIASNDNWKDTQQSEIEATNIPPTKDAESAIVETLAPGAYTAIVRGKNNTTGVALVEVYQLPN